MNYLYSTYSQTNITVASNGYLLADSSSDEQVQWTCEPKPSEFPTLMTKLRVEKDSETGLSYFGARYYEPEMLNVWLSVDPMADKYPNLSPYNYCAWTRPTGGDEHRWIKYNIVNNPVKLEDPDGRDWDPTTEEKYIKPYEAELISRIDYFNSINGRPLTEEEKSQFDECTASLNEISQLRDDPNTIYTIM